MAVRAGERRERTGAAETAVEVGRTRRARDAFIQTRDGAVGGLSGDARPALLGAQDRQRARQAAEAPAGLGARCTTSGKPTAERPRRRRSTGSSPPTRTNSPRRRVPGQGSRGVAGLLRLSRRELAAHPHDQSHRIDVRHHPLADPDDQELRERQDRAQPHGSARHERPETMATTTRLPATRRYRRRSEVYRWNRREKNQ